MANDLLIVFQSYLILWGFQLLAWPWVSRIFHQLADKGWALGRVGLTLVISFVIWWLAYLKIPANTDIGITFVLVLIASTTWFRFKKGLKQTLILVKKNWKIILAEEVIFLIGYFGFSLIRSYQPDILGLEKYMDFGFINSYLHSPTLPAADMWFAGKTINYYSFGHFWASNIIRTWGVSPAIGYNLMLAFLFAGSLLLAFSVIYNIGSSWVAGVIGALLVVVGGNSHTIWTLLSKRNLNGYWYADATRFIHNTIHEFPSYSFTVSDLHAHVYGLPVVLFFILLLVLWWNTQGQVWINVLLGWLLGIMAMTNSWDSLNYGLLLIVFCGLKLMSDRKSFGSMLKVGVTVGACAILTALPWITGFKSISSGIGAVVERSPIWQLMALWTIHLVFCLTAMIIATKQKKSNLLIIAMGITAITLIMIPEFVYVRDIYTTHPRANTMFKLTFQSFVMMSIMGGFLIGKIGEIKKMKFKLVGVMIFMAMVLSLMLFPYESYSSYYNKFSEYHGLDGVIHLATSNPIDLEMIGYLDKNRNGKNMIEAPGDSFTEYNTISSYTGIPTVLGWRAHEWLWRGGYDEIGARDGEVEKFYEGADENETRAILQKYNIGWVIISKREREKYLQLNESKVLRLGKIVFSDGDSYILKTN